MTQCIAITGATGFLGRYVVRAALERGHSVRILSRRHPVHPQVADLTFEVVPGDLSDGQALARLVENADAVIHIAGLIKARRAQSLMEVNVGGAEAVASVAASAKARFVLVSSLAAREPGLSPYAHAKRTAEEAASRHFRSSAAWAIARLSAVYGPWDRETLSIFKLLGARLALIPGRRQSRVCLIHAADAARALVCLAEKGAPSGLFEISDERSDGYRWDEIATIAGLILGGRPKPVFLPPALTIAWAALVRTFAQATGQDSIVSLGKVRELLHPDWGLHGDRQIPGHIWRPQIELATGFGETLRWYHSHGLL